MNLLEAFNSHPVQSECPDGISGLLGGLSRCRLPRPLPVWVPTVCPLVQHLPSCRAERRSSRREKREEEERPQRASETRVSLCFVLQGHAGCYQGAKSQRYIWRSFEDSSLHVGQSGGGAETGERKTHRMPAVMEIWQSFCHDNCLYPALNNSCFQVYKRKNEAAKKDYLKALAEYKAGQISQVRASDWH